MKVPRTDKTAVVIARNRRVYARVFKMDKALFAFAERYMTREAKKSIPEGFRPIGLSLDRFGDTYIFKIDYVPAV